MSKKNQNYTNRKQNRFQPERMRGNVFVNNSGKQWLPGENGRAAKVERLLRGAKEEKKEIASTIKAKKHFSNHGEASFMSCIGEIPDEWGTTRISNVISKVKEQNKNGKEKQALQFTYGEIIPKKDFDADKEEYVAKTMLTYNLVQPGDIILNCLNLNYDFVTQRIGLVKDSGAITSAYIAMRCNTEKLSSEYAAYFFKACDACKIFHTMGSGVRKTLTFTELQKKEIPLPPLPEQQRIADFLDTKCGILDRTIDAVSRQIEDLEKYKRALITKTVTKGICKKGEPERAMKDSGVEWIGEVPEEWDVKRNSLNFDIRKTLVGENWSNMQLLSLTTNGVKNITIDDQVGKRPKTLATYQIAHKNDIVMCLFDLDASAVFSGLCKKNGIISPAYKLLKCKNGMFPPYAEYYFRAVFDGRKYKKYAKSIRYTISTNDFMHLKMPVPPLAEQQQIADYLDEKCKNINNRVQKRRQQLEWLKEYKKSLIFDYVTGKKRV